MLLKLNASAADYELHAGHIAGRIKRRARFAIDLDLTSSGRIGSVSDHYVRS